MRVSLGAADLAVRESMSPLKRQATSLIVTAVLVLGCSQSLAIWVIEGSTIDRLLFGISYFERDTVPVTVYSLTVEECYVPDTVVARTYWKLAYAGDGRLPKFRQVEYGQPPPAYRSPIGPKPLMRGSCYYAHFQRSRSSYPWASVAFLTDSFGVVTPIDGFRLEALRLPGSMPLVVPDSARTRIVPGEPTTVIASVRHVLTAQGFVIASSGPSGIATAQLKLGRDWSGRDVAERIDCGRWVEGSNRVRLPLSRDSAGGYGHLLVTVQARVAGHTSGTLLILEPEVWLNPPWFEHGDRPMMPCALRQSFVTDLLDDVANHLREAAGGA